MQGILELTNYPELGILCVANKNERQMVLMMRCNCPYVVCPYHGNCDAFMRRYFYGPLHIPDAQVTRFDIHAADLDAACKAWTR